MKQKMKWLLIVFSFLLISETLHAQRKGSRTKANTQMNIPMTAEAWEAQPGKIEFGQHKGVAALKVQRGGVAILKNIDFVNGTIEFDAEPLDASAAPFVSCYFRAHESGEAEVFYLRVGREENHKRNDAVQYAPLIKGVNLWDMLPQYQGPSVLHNKDWNHIKLVVSGMQMRAYVNDMSRPALQIPYLEGNIKHGKIALEGFAAFANLIITPDAVEDLQPRAGVDLTDHDANYLRNWYVSQPAPLEDGRELSAKDLPDADVKWDSLTAERNGLINITRKFGVGERRYVWLKTNLKSTADLQRKIQLGFSDEVWVFVNRRMVYVDKNLYIQQMRKNPNGRCSIENSSFTLPLTSGDNELLIGIANNFYGWGIIARLENIEGVEFVP
jgi:hypothetical protein